MIRGNRPKSARLRSIKEEADPLPPGALRLFFASLPSFPLLPGIPRELKINETKAFCFQRRLISEKVSLEVSRKGAPLRRASKCEEETLPGEPFGEQVKKGRESLIGNPLGEIVPKFHNRDKRGERMRGESLCLPQKLFFSPALQRNADLCPSHLPSQNPKPISELRPPLSEFPPGTPQNAGTKREAGVPKDASAGCGNTFPFPGVSPVHWESPRSSPPRYR